MTAEESVHQKPHQRSEWDKPETGIHDEPVMEEYGHPLISVHSFIRSIRSTARVARARKTAMMMASPTAASAAATIITKKTKICPFTACHWWAKVTNERLTALSMSSMDMKTVIRLRLMRKPATPSENSTALRSRYQEMGTSCVRNEFIRRPSLPGFRGGLRRGWPAQPRPESRSG